MTQYLLSLYQPDGEPPAPEILNRIMSDLTALDEELRSVGAWVFTAGLHAPSSASVVRPSGQDSLITDGPFIEGKEHIGGFTVIEAADLDEALGWARKMAQASTLPIEVRPVQGEDG